MSEITSEKQFLELLPQLAQNNYELGVLNKAVKADKDLLKEYMLAEDIESAEADGWQVTCSQSVKSTMDEPMLLSIIESLIQDVEGTEKEALQNLIVMKPTINEELLEDLIYNKQLDAEIIKPAVVESVSYTLRFKKAKKKSSKSRKNS
jgi:hypothetical protein